ncbi:hypothetical protein [Chitiniphilus eburneus]|uniref:Uncharacterized protein n=1 Tax=Chitiniphilus eburneus TaxID=2571148 RepID=A0A4U0Q3F4_9NEIS|nr:hypothetical protein [Chitiniphilus eburneus]TJZ75596.1 hypothetical protein FAZ21_06690 [Chitiniphilus eburneus]
MSTKEFLDSLTYDQLVFCHEEAGKLIAIQRQKAQAIVYCVTDGITNDGWYRASEYEKAAEHLLRIYKDRFVEVAARFNERPCGTQYFEEQLPSIEVRFIHEADWKEWFPDHPFEPAPHIKRGDE